MNSLTRHQMDLMFRKVVDTCEKKLYDPKLNGVNWRHLAEERKERILAADSEEELEREFNELIKELKVSHAGFYHLSYAHLRRVSWGPKRKEPFGDPVEFGVKQKFAK